MSHEPATRARRSIRLTGYDYSGAGACFVTICAHERRCVFGDVMNGEMRLNAWGRGVEEEWRRTGAMRARVRLGAFVVMPDHFHALIELCGCRGTLQHALADSHTFRQVARLRIGRGEGETT